MATIPPIVNESTSVVQINGSALQNGAYAIVYLSTTTIPEQLVTIRDATGFISSPQGILLSSVAGGGTYSNLLQQRFGYITLTSDANGLDWSPVATHSFPDPSADTTYKAMDAISVTANQVVASDYLSTVAVVATRVETVALNVSTVMYASTFYVNSFSRFQANPADFRFFIGDGVKVVGSTLTTGGFIPRGIVSTGGDFLAAGNISSRSGTVGVGGDLTMTGSLRAPRATFTVGGSTTIAGPAVIRGQVTFASSVTSGNRVATPLIGTRITEGSNMAIASSLQLATTAFRNRVGFLQLLAPGIQTPSVSLPSNVTSSNSVQTSNLTFQSATGLQTLTRLTLSSAQIVNPGGSLVVSSIAGTTLFSIDSIQTPRSLIRSEHIMGGIAMNDKNPNGTLSVSYPGGTYTIDNYWTISSAGTGGTFSAPNYTLSTNFILGTLLNTPRLDTIEDTIGIFNANAMTVFSSVSISTPSGGILSASNTPFINVGGSIRGTISTTAETLTADTLITREISASNPVRFTGPWTMAAFSTVALSSLTSHTITTSSLQIAGGTFGRPLLYSTVNPNAPWMLPSTFQMDAPPFTTTSGLGTTFQPILFTAAKNQTAYYSIIDPSSRIPTTLSSFYINTLAGTGVPGSSGDGGRASNAQIGLTLGQPAADTASNVYIGSKSLGWKLQRVDATGRISTIAGNYQYYYGDGGNPLNAAFGPKLFLTVANIGSVIINDVSNGRFRYTQPNSNLDPTVFTIAGNGGRGYSGDGGLAPLATFSNPSMVVTSVAGSTVYIVDSGNNMIRRITQYSTLTRYAGNTTPGNTGDGGPALSALFASPYGAALHDDNNLFISDTSNCVVRRISTTTGVIDLVAGNYTPGYSGDGGPATAAQLLYPKGIAVDFLSNVFVSDSGNRVIRKIETNSGKIFTYAGDGTEGYSGDGGPATAAQFSSITGIATDEGGNLYIADTNNQIVRFIDRITCTIRTVAGRPRISGNTGDGSFATFATLSNPSQVHFDEYSGYLFIADEGNNRIRFLDANTGILFPYAGNGSPPAFGDGLPATRAVFSTIHSVATDTNRRLYISDSAAGYIRTIHPSTLLFSTVAGQGGQGYGGDGGPAIRALLSSPTTVVSDASNNLYIADTNNHRIRRLDAATGLITTVAGNGNTGYFGDGVQATSTTLTYPRALTVDSARQLLYIGDTSNYRVRRVDLSSGLITTYVGTGLGGTITPYFPGILQTLGDTSALTVDSSGAVYLTDKTTNAVWYINPYDTHFFPQNTPSTLGTYLGDGGPFSNAYLNQPSGAVCDPSGNLVVADAGNYRLRRTYTYGIPQVPVYLNMDFKFTEYFTSTGQSVIGVNGNTVATFNASTTVSSLTYRLTDTDIWSYPLQNSNPVFGDQTPYVQITTTSNTGANVKLEGELWVNSYPGQHTTETYLDSDAGIQMNLGVLRFPNALAGPTIQNRYNDASLRNLNYTGSLNFASDPVLKEAIQPADLSRCATDFAALPLRTYRYTAPYVSTFHTPPQPRLGFLTSEVAPVFPKSVTQTPFEFPWAPSTIQTLSVDQVKMAHLGTTQTLMAQIEALETALAELQAAITTQRNKSQG